VSAQRRFLISLAVSLLVWAVYSWPLPLQVSRAIPSSAQNTEPRHVRTMIAGDHLQLLYQFWLAGDMIRGKTPLFHNLYEFNTGDDSARYQLRTHYLPFSFVFLLGELAGGRAFGWNVAGFVSLWLTYYLTWLLIRRYVRDDGIAAAAALVGLAFPFRWINLLGGSPMGYAMVWAPALLLGLDLALRDRRRAGGWLAGLAVLFSAWTDSHMFFFAVLLVPAWCLMTLLVDARSDADRSPGIRSLVRQGLRTLWPVAVLTLAAFAISQATMSKGAGAVMNDGGRSLVEVNMFSPRWTGLFRWNEAGVSGQIYFGYALLVLLAAGGLVLLLRAIRRDPQDGQPGWRPLLLFALLAVAVAGILALALGTHGPLHGKLLWLARKIVPPYTMIRQPAKIFCLLPTLLALMAALSWSALALSLHRQTLLKWGLLVWSLVLAIEYRSIVSPTLCRLDPDQAAYKAVADDAAAAQIAPRILVLPLWPGDSHWASLYEHYVSLYRIRMINGYHPIVRKNYMDEIFQRLEGVNKGWLPDEQLAFLQQAGIRYIMLHENAFPEKVSPFPVGFTLRRLLDHPRLRLLANAGEVWAFKITEAAEPKPQSSLPECALSFPARRWEAESLMGPGMQATGGESADRPRHAVLQHTADVIETRSLRTPAAPDLVWMLRVRGEGTLSASLLENGQEGASNQIITVSAPQWAWITVPLKMTTPYASVAGRFKPVQGSVAVDMISLSAGTWTAPAAGQSLTFPASCFFHAGYSLPLTGEVVLTAGRDPADVVFYGLRLPLEPGVYATEMIFATAAPDGVVLGQWLAGSGKTSDKKTVTITAGQPAVCTWEQADNRPCSLEFRFAGNADLRIREVRLTRVK
jgi:hypothetical protein